MLKLPGRRNEADFEHGQAPYTEFKTLHQIKGD